MVNLVLIRKDVIVNRGCGDCFVILMIVIALRLMDMLVIVVMVVMMGMVLGKMRVLWAFKTTITTSNVMNVEETFYVVFLR